jgi:hypothetical protein
MPSDAEIRERELREQEEASDLRRVNNLAVALRVPMFYGTLDKIKDLTAAYERETGRRAAHSQVAAAVLEWAVGQPGMLGRIVTEVVRHGALHADGSKSR